MKSTLSCMNFYWKAESGWTTRTLPCQSLELDHLVLYVVQRGSFDMSRHDRRRFLKLTGTAATGVLAGLAGCSGGDNGGSDGGDDSGGDGGGGTTGNGTDPVTVGLYEPLSGPLSSSGQQALQGSQLAVERLNENGGIAGREIELITADTEASPDTAVQRIRAMIQQDGAEIIIGGVSSAVSKAANQFTTTQNVPLMVTASATPDLVQEECESTTFRININLIHQQRATAQVLLNEGGPTKVAAVEPDYVYGQQSWDVFQEYYGSLVDMNVVGEQFPAFLKGDFSKEIQATLDTDPDLVHSSLYSGDMITFIKQAKQFDFFQQIDTFVAGVVPVDVTAALGSEMPDNAIAVANSYFRHPEDNQQLQSFNQRYFDAYSEVPTGFTLDTVAGWDALKQAGDQAGSVEPEALTSALEGLQVDSVYNARIRPEDHQGIRETVPGGKMAPLDQQYADFYGNDQFYWFPELQIVGRDEFVAGAQDCSF
jgi:branched-chain amino acid transport system substrate-binding protein